MLFQSNLTDRVTLPIHEVGNNTTYKKGPHTNTFLFANFRGRSAGSKLKFRNKKYRKGESEFMMMD